jgi:circadian clock protein KaiC
MRNMRSIGIALAPHLKSGQLQFHATRPSLYGLEMHLVTMYDLIHEHKPRVVIMDPITDFSAVGSRVEIKAAIIRIIDFLKSSQITALFTSYLNEAAIDMDASMVGVSSLIDAWISLRSLESDGEQHRGLFVLKARGMAHSNQIRSFQLTEHGIQIGALDLAGRRMLVGESSE